MGAAYEYRKVYVDLLTPQGELWVVYLNYVRLAGAWTARAGLERYTPDGRRTLAHSPASPALVDADTPVEALPLSMPLPAADGLPAGELRLELEVVQGAWQPPQTCPVPELHWSVRAARTRAVARLGAQAWEGTGYVDYVCIRKPTRLVGLRKLRWGRTHLPDRTVVSEHLEATGGRRWDTGFEWPLLAVVPVVLHEPSRLDDAGHGQVPLPDGLLRLDPERLLHRGDAFDPDRVPRRLDRWACNAIGGPTMETRWLGRARIDGLQAPALYEAVTFG